MIFYKLLYFCRLRGPLRQITPGSVPRLTFDSASSTASPLPVSQTMSRNTGTWLRADYSNLCLQCFFPNGLFLPQSPWIMEHLLGKNSICQILLIYNVKLCLKLGIKQYPVIAQGLCWPFRSLEQCCLLQVLIKIGPFPLEFRTSN